MWELRHKLSQYCWLQSCQAWPDIADKSRAMANAIGIEAIDLLAFERITIPKLAIRQNMSFSDDAAGLSRQGRLQHGLCPHGHISRWAKDFCRYG